MLICMIIGSYAQASHAQSTQFNGVTVPGVVIDHSPASTGVYLTSPTITIMSDGSYIAATDLSGPGSTEFTIGHTRVYRSTDDGQSWTQQSEVAGAFWSSVFEYDNQLYLAGPSKAGGDWVIRASSDNGATWTNPTDSSNGLIAQGVYGSSPNHVESYGGRLWIAASGPRAFSAEIGTNLLDANNWIESAIVPEEFEWFNENITWSESQVVVSPQTGLVMMPKIKNHPVTALLRADPNNGQLTLDDENDFVDLPGADKKFGAKYDPVSGKFYVLSNVIPSAHADETPTNAVRNTTGIVSSKDLYNWNVEKVFMYTPNLSNREGFNYLMFDIDDDDLAVVSRTSWDDGLGGADSNGNSNFFTFHRIEDFRTASPEQVLIADTNNNRVMRYEVTQTEFWAPIGEFALGNTFAGAALDQPAGLAQDANGYVYVSEQKDGGRVLRFDALGNFVSVVATEGVEFTGQPEALTVGPDGNLYMSVAFGVNSDKIYKVDLSDDTIATFVGSSFAGGTLDNPHGVSFGPDGNLYVADRQNSKVRKFSGADGTYLGDLYSGVQPEALTWDESRQKFLASSRDLDVDLNSVALNGSSNKFYDPDDIGVALGIVAIDGDIYWSDFDNDQIYKFTGLNQKVSSVPVDLDGPGRLLHVDQAASGERAWQMSGSADWKEMTNWYYWGRPDTNEEIANLGSAASSSSTITMNQSYTMKGLRFRNENTYTIDGAGDITLEADNENAVLDAQLGSHNISVNVLLNSDVIATTSNSTEIHFSNKLDLNGHTLSLHGEGRLSIGNQLLMNGGVFVLDGLSSLTFVALATLTLNGDLEFEPDSSLSLSLNSTFQLINGITNATGQFNNLILPDLEDGLVWDTSNFYVDGSLSIAPLLSADFNQDGLVDGLDFLRWQRGFGTDLGTQNTASLADGNANGDQFIDKEDLAIWQAQYGTQEPPLSTSSAVVPEPTSLVLLGCLTPYLLRVSFRSRREKQSWPI